MSTRSIIVVTGKSKYGTQSETVRLYKHSDGYPTGNLPVIIEALKKSVEQHKEQCKRFKEEFCFSKLNVEQVTGNLIGAATTVYGMGASIEECVGDEFSPEHLGSQSDLEWIYIVDLSLRQVRIYGGGFTGKSPQYAYNKGTIDPLIYAERLRAEYQSDEAKETEKLVNELIDVGYGPTMGGLKPKRKGKVKKATKFKPDLVIYRGAK